MTASVLGVPYEFKKCDPMTGENMKVYIGCGRCLLRKQDEIDSSYNFWAVLNCPSLQSINHIYTPARVPGHQPLAQDPRHQGWRLLPQRVKGSCKRVIPVL